MGVLDMERSIVIGDMLNLRRVMQEERQPQAAAHTGISPTNYPILERGFYKMPVDFLPQVAAYLGCEPKWLQDAVEIVIANAEDLRREIGIQLERSTFQRTPSSKKGKGLCVVRRYEVTKGSNYRIESWDVHPLESGLDKVEILLDRANIKRMEHDNVIPKVTKLATINFIGAVAIFDSKSV